MNFDDWEDWDGDEDDAVEEGASTCTPLASVDDIVHGKHSDPAFLYRLRGKLADYINALGYKTPAQVAAVEAALEGRYPTLEEETDRLFQLIEQDLLETCLGGSSRVLDERAYNENEVILEYESQHHKLKSLQLLQSIRLSRLEIRKVINGRYLGPSGTETD
jgi:hypothetical protein